MQFCTILLVCVFLLIMHSKNPTRIRTQQLRNTIEISMDADHFRNFPFDEMEIQ